MSLPRLLTLGLVSVTLLTGAVACSTSGGDSEGAATTTTSERSTTTRDGSTTTSTTDPGGETTTSTTDPGPDADDADRQAYVDALTATFDSEDAQLFEPGQVDCLAGGFVDTLGVGNLKDAGLSPKDLADTDGSEFPDELGVDEAKANDLYDVYGDCDIDLAGLFKKLFSGEQALTPAQEACFDKLLTDDKLRASLVAEFLGKDIEDDPLEAVSSCVGPTSGSVTGSTAAATPVTPAN